MKYVLSFIIVAWCATAAAGATVPVESPELIDRMCRVAHDRLEHDNYGNIRGISTFYVCPGRIVRKYRDVK